MKDIWKPLVLGLATVGSAHLLDIGTAKYIADHLKYLKDLPLAIKQPGIDILVNSAMSYATLHSAVDNWFPALSPLTSHSWFYGLPKIVRKALNSTYSGVVKVYNSGVGILGSRIGSLSTALALGYFLTFPTSTANDLSYLTKKTLKGEPLDAAQTLVVKAICFEKIKSLDELVEQHGGYHKEALSAEKYKNPKLSSTVKKALDPRLPLAVERIEGRGRWCEVGQPPFYEKGPMQLTDDIVKEYNVEHPFVVRENIMGGTSFLADLLLEYNGDKRLAVGAYNAGRKGVYSERAANYAAKVLKEYSVLQEKFDKDLKRKVKIPRPPRKRAIILPEFKIGHMPAVLTRN